MALPDVIEVVPLEAPVQAEISVPGSKSITNRSLVLAALGAGQAKEQAMLCANGFRDTTRIASGSPEMWRDIALANRRNLAQTLDRLMNDLRGFQRALKKADGKAISKFFESAKEKRDRWSLKGTARSPE